MRPFLAVLLMLVIVAPAYADVPISLLVLIEKTRKPEPPAPPVVPPGPARTVIHEECEGLGCDKCGVDGRIEVGGPAMINAALTRARIPWTTLEKAQASGKHIWIRFTARDCGPCHRATDHLNQLAAAGRLQKTLGTFACVHDVSPSYSQPSALAQRYGVHGFPTDIFIPAGSSVMYRYTGPPGSANAYVSRLRQGLDVVSPSRVQPVATSTWPTYPTRPVMGRPYTGCNSWRHLTVGEHAGKFNHQWLQTLSWDSLQSLHADDHDGVVREQYVVRPQRAAAQATVSRPPPPAGYEYGDCPGGICPVPQSRGRLFGIFR